MSAKDAENTYSAEEVQRRFEAALRGARIAEPKPLKDVSRKGAASKGWVSR